MKNNFMKDQRLYREQWVPRPIDEVFAFFCDEKNLEAITPPFLNFKVLGKSTPVIQEGTLIDYRLSLHGIPFRWQTRIESWVPGKQFVDTQLKGPYQKWHHTHRFIEQDGGTLMTDEVLYRLPLGILGHWVAGWKVRKDVNAIFQYRQEVIERLFPRRLA